jgi:tetratricopeptide (TPR) repeat protein
MIIAGIQVHPAPSCGRGDDGDPGAVAGRRSRCDDVAGASHRHRGAEGRGGEDVHGQQLGGVLGEVGRHDEAERLLTDALERLRAAYGPSHPEVAESLYELGLLAHARGSHSDADSLLRQSLAMRRELLGEGHVLTAQTLGAKGAVRLARGDGLGARQALEASLDVLERALPATHPLVVSSRRDLARARQVERR